MTTKSNRLTRLPGAYGAAIGAPTEPPPILVIDDQVAAGATTESHLVAAGYPTAREHDGDAVLRLVRAHLMRLVISELYIPCIEGPCVVSALKQERARLPHLRVLVYTRHTTGADDAWALGAGADGVLHKPASDAAIVREVRRLEGTDQMEPSEHPGIVRTGNEGRAP